MDLILIEGIPGSGKSTLAEMLCEVAHSGGLSASWYLEESKDHPVHPHNGTRDKVSPKYYLEKWEDFISTNISLDHLFIIEGSLFQSSVRFMMEGNSEELIPPYFSSCESVLARVSPKLIYLRPPEIEPHIDWVMNHRGEEWADQVTTYLEKTPFCASRGWQGANCMRQFWSYYASLCDSLVFKTTIQSSTINCDLGYFENQFKEALEYTNLDQWLNKSKHAEL